MAHSIILGTFAALIFLAIPAFALAAVVAQVNGFTLVAWCMVATMFIAMIEFAAVLRAIDRA